MEISHHYDIIQRNEVKMATILHNWWKQLIQWTLTNPNSLGPDPVQISESFGLVNAYSLNEVLLNFYTIPYLLSCCCDLCRVAGSLDYTN